MSALHGLEYLLTSLWLGGLFFHGWIVPAAPAAAPRDSNWSRGALLRLGWAFFGFSLAWCFVLAAEMSDSWQISEITSAILVTRFGHLWCLRLGLALVSLLLLRTARIRTAFFVSLSLPLLSSFVGHAGSQLHSTWISWTVILDFVHFVGVSLWSGGLVALFSWLSRWNRRTPQLAERDLSHRVVERFSKLAMTSTGALAAAGLTLAITYGVDPFHPWGTNYGLLVLAKIALFGLALAAAAINQFIHLKRWDPEKERAFSRGIYREVGVEILLMIAVFFVAGFLTRTDLPGS